MKLPQTIYLKRKLVVAEVGGKYRLAALERAGLVRRYALPGYKIAHYLRTEVEAALARGEPIDTAPAVSETARQAILAS